MQGGTEEKVSHKWYSVDKTQSKRNIYMREGVS